MKHENKTHLMNRVKLLWKDKILERKKGGGRLKRSKLAWQKVCQLMEQLMDASGFIGNWIFLILSGFVLQHDHETPQ